MDPLSFSGALPSMDRLRLAISEPAQIGMPAFPGEAGPGKMDFAKVLRAALDGPDAVHKAADDKVRRFVSGEEVPVHEVMASLAEADLSMRLLTQVTSRVIAAYQEVARMQV